MADPSEQDLRLMGDIVGLNPVAPPPTLPANGQGPSPAPVPAQTQVQGQGQPQPDLNYSERQRWGTQALPGQTFVPRDAYGEPVTAFDTGPPPVQPGPPNQQALDDAREWDRGKEDEARAYHDNEYSGRDYNPSREKVTPQQHAEWERLQTAKQMLGQIRDAKEFQRLEPHVRRLEAKIKSETKARDDEMRKQRADRLKQDDAPYQSVEARKNTAGLMEGYVTDEISKTLAMSQSNNAAQKRQGDYDLSVSGITTLTSPKPGTDPNAKPDASNRDFTALRDMATDLVVHNRKLPDGAAAVRYINKMATPGGGIDEKGNQITGFNGRTGVGAANYKVIGRDEVGNVMVQMNDGVKLRVPQDTYKRILQARQQGAQRAQQWEIDYKKSQEPGMVRRAINWGLSKIPAQGF